MTETERNEEEGRGRQRRKEREAEMTEHGCRSGGEVVGTIAVTTLAVRWYTLPMLRTHGPLLPVSLFAVPPSCSLFSIGTGPVRARCPPARPSVYVRTIHGLRVSTRGRSRLSFPPPPRLGNAYREELGGSLLPWSAAKARTENRDRAIY